MIYSSLLKTIKDIKSGIKIEINPLTVLIASYEATGTIDARDTWIPIFIRTSYERFLCR